MNKVIRPQSQGKMERAREIKRRLHDIANGITLRECADSDAHFLHDLADNLPAIQQAALHEARKDVMRLKKSTPDPSP